MNENKSFPKIENRQTIENIFGFFNDIKEQCTEQEYNTLFKFEDEKLKESFKNLSVRDELTQRESRILYEVSEKIKIKSQSFSNQSKHTYIRARCNAIQNTLEKGKLVNTQPNQINGFNL